MSRRAAKWVIVLIAAAMLAVAVHARAEDDADGGKAAWTGGATLGDNNGDGYVSAADAAVLLRAIAKKDALFDTAFEMADITQNGLLDEVDVRASLWAAAGLIPDTVKFAERVSTGLIDEARFDLFRYDGITDDMQGNYVSASVRVNLTEGEAYNSTYYLADIYVQELNCLVTAFPGGSYGNHSGFVAPAAARLGAVIAINGDYFSARKLLPLVRNGVVYKSGLTPSRDMAVLTYDGVLHTYKVRQLNRQMLLELKIYQTWAFGPALLDAEGKAETSFNTQVGGANPRTVIGYYEPGHYCFLVVDGRQGAYSTGMRMAELAALCEELGMQAAYNLDGGQTSAMATRYGLVNRPTGGGRAVSDMVYIQDREG